MSNNYQPHPLRVRRQRTKGYRMPADVIAVACFRILVEFEPETIADIQRELKGKRLACWCRLDQPCHADVLAEIANR